MPNLIIDVTGNSTFCANFSEALHRSAFPVIVQASLAPPNPFGKRIPMLATHDFPSPGGVATKKSNSKVKHGLPTG